jgi:hypothetical protein
MYDNTRAAYRVLDPSGFYSDNDTLYLADEFGNPAEIYFDGIPNEQLEPLNELARQRLTAYLDLQDALGRAAAEKLNRPFVGRPRNLDGAVELATAIARNDMSIQGTKNKASNTELVETRTPQTGATLNPNKRKVGRPPKNASAA